MLRFSLFPVLLCLFMLSPGPGPAFAQQQTPILPDIATDKNGPAGDRLETIWGLARSLGSTSLIILHQGRTILDRGDTVKKTSSHSLRKSLMNALIGRAVDQGLIDLDLSLADLGIDDRQPLSATEKQATVKDLLMSKSGVFLPAAAESDEMKRNRPPRHAHLPGTHFFYNNWDFNALGTIFSKATGRSIGGAFGDWIAGPLGMEDFRIEDVHLSWDPASIHPAYPFYVTTRDLAKFGQLYLQEGQWQGQRIIPAQWIKESTSAYTCFEDMIGYGYLWWTYFKDGFFGAGFGGQYLVVIPSRDLVIVNRVDSGRPGPERRAWLADGETVTGPEMLRIVKEILAVFPEQKDEKPKP